MIGDLLYMCEPGYKCSVLDLTVATLLINVYQQNISSYCKLVAFQ